MEDESQNNIKWHETISKIMNELVATKRDLQKKNDALEKALNEVKTLQGLIPICASCKNIRNDQGYWYSVEKYLSEHSDLEFTHSICPDCLEKLYPEYSDKNSDPA